MMFTETRGNDGHRPPRVRFSEALLSPVASFGGIYSPETLPPIEADFLERHLGCDYQQLALDLLRHFAIDIDEEILRRALATYDKFDDAHDPVPLADLGGGLFVGELYHGPTRAFKDMALQPFGVILSALASRRGEQYLILTATSGDTGPAALDTFRGRENIRVACMYPAGGTSDVQRLQMVTESAPNLKALGIHGNFDDAQTALKTLLASSSFNARLENLGIRLSAANSVNFGRIVFQILYQFHCYLELRRRGAIEAGEAIVVHIPSGNFGNALGAYFARRMGLPIERIAIASNANNVLTEWIDSGRYDQASRELIATTSPAMDILKSSNVERVLFDLFGAERTRELMAALDNEGIYQLADDEADRIREFFAADYCSDDEALGYIRQANERGYLLDPHTAICFKTCSRPEFADRVNLIYSTAEWTKFAPVVDQALHGGERRDDRAALAAVAGSAGIEIPPIIGALFDKPVAQPDVVDPADIESAILGFLEP